MAYIITEFAETCKYKRKSVIIKSWYKNSTVINIIQNYIVSIFNSISNRSEYKTYLNKFSIFYKIDFLGIRRRIINQLMKYVFLFKKLMINVIPFVRNMSELKFTYKIPSFCVHKKVSLVNIIYIQVFFVCEVCLVWK